MQYLHLGATSLSGGVDAAWVAGKPESRFREGERYTESVNAYFWFAFLSIQRGMDQLRINTALYLTGTISTPL